ncbi:MAG: hypothetical protein STHCBS139747_007304 [Sporothrix thermara]
MSVQYIENGGGKLAVEVRGDASAPLVICSPGLGDFRTAYSAVADQLVAAGYRVALLDLRGQGDASLDFTSYGDEETASDLIKVAETLLAASETEAKRVVLAGASMSGAAATIAAGQRPDLVAGVILLCGFLRDGSTGPILPTLWPGLDAADAKARAQLSTDSLTRPGRWAAFQQLMGTLDHNADVTPWLAQVKQHPALVVVGDKDPDWSKPVEEAAWVARQFAPSPASSTLIVEGAGHAPQYEKPDVVGPEMVRFVNSLREGDSFRAVA